MAVADLEKLYGTAKPAAAVERYVAGPLSVDIEGGAVRYVRFNGHEAIRGVDYLVRDDSWRTPPAQLTPVSAEQGEQGFEVVFDGEVRQDDIHYSYRMTITGHADGRLEMVADGEALSTFMTNRTGFVVLHPIVGVAGRPVTVTDKDESTRETVFPELISPGQPIFDIRALTHEVAPGLSVTCRMEAALPYDDQAIFEMEDQRNWTDASYKTYVGSLLDPWPFRITEGDRIAQRVIVSFSGHAEPAGAGGPGGAALALGEGDGRRLPAIGLGLMSRYRDELARENHPAMALRPQFITGYVERDDPAFADIIGDYAAIAQALGAEVQLELVLPGDASPKPELDAAAAACRAAELTPARVVSLPRPYLRSIQPVGPWPEVCDLGHIYNKAREAFPDSAILGGMLTDFTELNRKRPPTAPVDGITCTTTPIVHAPDDTSVMETLETLPFTVASMAAMAGGKSLHIGPSSVAMRHNPNGTATAPNPEIDRIAMVEIDPRQRGLFAAAWAVGYAAAIAASGDVSTLALNHLAGPSGLVGKDGRLFPVYHVMAALCGAGGAAWLPIAGLENGLAGLAWQGEQGCRLLLANLGAERRDVRLADTITGTVLDSASFADAASDPGWSDQAGTSYSGHVSLGGFAVLFGSA